MQGVKLFTLLIGLTGGLLAEEVTEPVWQKALLGGLNMTQTGFDNWVAGGESAFAWQLNLNYNFVRDIAQTTWSNTGKFAYGATRTGDADMRKSADEIKLESVLTYKLGSKINPFVAITGETQFAPGYSYAVEPTIEISAFMDPGYFRESLGAGYAISDGIATRLGLSFKQTTTSAYPVPYADDPSTVELETFKSEVGAESVTDISLPVTETSVFSSKLELFSAFKALDETDVNWDNTLQVKLSKYLNVNLNLKLVYDKDISVKRQIKQTMALGLNYTFI